MNIKRSMAVVSAVAGALMVLSPVAASAATPAAATTGTYASACPSGQADAYAAVELTANGSVEVRDDWRLTATGHTDTDKVYMHLQGAGNGEYTLTWVAQNGGNVKWRWKFYVEYPQLDATGNLTWQVQKMSTGGTTDSVTIPLNTGNTDYGPRVVCYGVFRYPNPASCRPMDDTNPWLTS